MADVLYQKCVLISIFLLLSSRAVSYTHLDVYKRQALIITIAKKHFSFNEKSNVYSWHDVGLATAMLSVQATELNLFLHQMGGFNSAKAKEEFQIPDEYEAVSIIAVGYEGNPDALPENLRAREVGVRKRKPLSELVFSANFGEENELFKTETNK